MSLTCTVTPSAGGAATSFLALGSAATGRFLLDFEPGHPEQDKKRFRVPGMSGHYIVKGGKIGRRVRMVVQYVGADQATVVGYEDDDAEAWAAAPQDIVCDGETYSGCHLEDTKRISKMRGDGSSAILRTEYLWQEDDPA